MMPLKKASRPMLLVLLVSSATLGAPSFDCGKAGTASEKLICAHQDLAKLDAEIATSFAEALSHVPEKEKSSFRKRQRDWLDTRDKCLSFTSEGTTVQCLSRILKERKHKLSRLARTKDDAPKPMPSRQGSLSYRAYDEGPYQGALELSGKLGDLAVNRKILSTELQPASGDVCESPCSAMEDIEARVSLQCFGTCSYGPPQFLGADESTHLVFFYQLNGAGKDVPYSIYAVTLPDGKYVPVGHDFGFGASNGSYDAKTRVLTFSKSIHDGPRLKNTTEHLSYGPAPGH